MNPKAIRLLNQQLIAPQFTNPEDVVAHFGAMQAQDYRMVRWAVAMRTRKPSCEAFRKAYDNGEIIRTHLLRCTWQLIANEDYKWMMDLCSRKSMGALKGWMSSNNISIPEDELLHIREIIGVFAEYRKSVTKEDIAEALSQQDIRMDAHRLSYHIRIAELDSFLVSGDLHPSKATYCLASRKIKPAEKLERDEALALLAKKYFQSHSPATLEDFVWWSGLNIGDCRKGIELLGDGIHIVRWRNRDFYLLDGCRTRGFRKGEALLLAPYDEYLIGYKSRDIALAEKHKHHAHNNSGIFHPVIAYDGAIVGNWGHHGKTLRTSFFDDTTSLDLAEKQAEYITWKTT